MSFLTTSNVPLISTGGVCTIETPLDASTVTTMTEVRIAIDDLDRRIVTLLGERMRFIEAAARIKPSRDKVRDEWRKRDVINKAMVQAEEVNFSPSIVERIYEILVEGSIAHEFEKFDIRNDIIAASANGATNGSESALDGKEDVA
ncbi:hypothetical protein RUND412_002611 [Rhizina undulata]